MIFWSTWDKRDLALIYGQSRQVNISQAVHMSKKKYILQDCMTKSSCLSHVK